jgi:diaminopimelate decarboxylase/aspartate kinase
VNSKFGVLPGEAEELAELARTHAVRIVGLHAHTGSGILEVENWTETGELLGELARRFPEVSVVDLGGGIGVPEQAGQGGIDLAALDAGVAKLRRRFPQIEFWMEPGRYLVAKAGVLLATVTQLKDKGDVHYVGIATGMNSLIRPALYGAHHDIRNLTRLGEPLTDKVTVVGPICETADQLGSDRWLPTTREGDVLLIGNCGAYGYAMASHYNRRPPAAELVLES